MTESNEPVNPGESSPLRSLQSATSDARAWLEQWGDVPDEERKSLLVHADFVYELCTALVALTSEHTLSESESSTIQRIREAIAKDRCDGESEWARGVNAACQKHLAMIDAITPSHGELSYPEKQLVRDWRLHQPKCHSCGGFVKVEEGGICLTCHTEGQ